MALHYITGAASSGKSTFLYKRILKMAAEDIRKKYILIVPEQSALRAEQELIRQSDGSGVINVEVLSFTRLAYRLMEEACDNGYPVLNDMGKNMLIRRIMQECSDRLEVFRGKERNSGFVDEIKSEISEMCQYMISPDKLAEFENTAEKGLLKAKMSDFRVIYEEFLTKIKNVYQTAENMQVMCFKHIGTSELLSSAYVIFDGFTGFTPVQRQFIEHMMGKVSEIYMCLASDKDTVLSDGVDVSVSNGRRKIFSMTCETVETMKVLCEKNGWKSDILEYDEIRYGSEPLEHLKTNIFGKNFVQTGSGGGIHEVFCRDAKAEAIYISSQISELLREKNYKYKDIAIIVSDLDLYTPYFEKSLKDYGIPFYTDVTKDISDNPMIKFINNALSVIDSSYSREKVANLIKSPFAGYDEKTVYEMDNYLFCYNYRGRASYEREWIACKRLKKSVDLEGINEIRRDMCRHLDLLPGKLNNVNAAELCDGIMAFLESYGVSEKMSVLSEKYPEYVRVYDAVENILVQIKDIMGSEILTYREFKDIFLTGIKKTKLGVIPPSPDVILIGDLKRTRLDSIKVLFVAGVNEGKLPKITMDEGVFTDDDKGILRKAGIEMAVSSSEDPAREEFYIYLMMARPQNELYLCCSVLSDDGMEIRPSYIMKETAKLFKDDIRKKDSNGGIAQRLGFDRGVSYIVDCMSRERERKTVSDDLADKLFSWYKNNNMPELEEIENIRNDYIFDSASEGLSSEMAEKLYGKIINSSVSRIEEFAKCPFRHFMDYGLSISKREEPRQESIDLGNVCHEVMKRFGEKIMASGNRWNELKKDVYYPMIAECVEETVSIYADGIYKNDEFMESLTRRTRRLAEICADVMVKQIQAGEYKPVSYEEPFSMSSAYMKLRGRIDRVDMCDGTSGKYVKVIDYKTGDEKLDFARLYNGIQLQLSMYLNYLVKEKKFGDVIPAAALYQRLDAPLLDSNDINNDVDKGIYKELRPSGMIYQNPENIRFMDRGMVSPDGKGYISGYTSEVSMLKTNKSGILSSGEKGSVIVSLDETDRILRFAEDKAVSLSHEIMDGHTEIKPYKCGNETACKFCDYADICGFDEKLGKHTYNRIPKDSTKAFNRIVNGENEGN